MFTPKNRETDKPRGFSFIRYRRVEDAEDAIRGMNGRVRKRGGIKSCCSFGGEGGKVEGGGI